MAGAFVEQDCTFEHKGETFTSGGAWLLECTDGYWRGVVYCKPEKRCVTDWHGNKIADATFGPVYRGAFCKMRSVVFTHNGIRFAGRYCPDWADCCRVRSTKKVTSK